MEDQVKRVGDLYAVSPIPGKAGRDFLRRNHYSKSCHNGPTCFGLWLNGVLVGVCAFATPCSENVRAKLFGPENKHRVTELHRLFTPDGVTNLTSWFVARSLKALVSGRPHLRAVISFADATEGHTGTVYQALNASYFGTTPKARFFRDSNGALRHPRQNGKNISLKAAREMGWEPEMREGKHRYVWIVGPRSERKSWTTKLHTNLGAPLPYPKG